MKDKLYDIINELNMLLSIIDSKQLKGDNFNKELLKFTNSVRYINENLDQKQIEQYLNDHYFEYGDVILEILKHSHFQPKTFH